MREFGLLEFLMLRRGDCCTRTELLSKVWHGTPNSGTNIVDVYVTYLRKKFTAARPEAKLGASAIETVRGSGYRLRDKHTAARQEAPAAPVAKEFRGDWVGLARPA